MKSKDRISDKREVSDAYITAADKYERQEDFRSAILVYEMGLRKDPSDTTLVGFMYSAMLNLRQDMIKNNGTTQEELDHLQGNINEFELKYKMPHNLEWSLESVLARNVMRKADDLVKEGEVEAATTLYFAAYRSDPSNEEIKDKLCKYLGMIKEHKIDQGADNEEIESVNMLIRSIALADQKHD